MTVAQAEWIKRIADTLEAFEGFDGCLISSVKHSTGEQGGDVLLMVRGVKADVPLRIKPDGTVFNVVSAQVDYRQICEQIKGAPFALPEPTLQEIAQALNAAGLAAMYFHSGGGVMTVTVYDSREIMDNDQYAYRLMVGGGNGEEWGADVFEFDGDPLDKAEAEHAWSETTEATDVEGIVGFVEELLTRAQAHQSARAV